MIVHPDSYKEFGIEQKRGNTAALSSAYLYKIECDGIKKPIMLVGSDGMPSGRLFSSVEEARVYCAAMNIELLDTAPSGYVKKWFNPCTFRL